MINTGLINSYVINGTAEAGLSASVSEGIGITLAFEGVPSVVASELIRISSSLNSVVGFNLFETVSVASEMLQRGDQFLSFSEDVGIADSLKVAYPVVINNSITLDDTLQDVLAKLSFAVESFEIQDGISSRATYNKLLVDLFTLTSVINVNNFAEVLSDAIALADETVELHKLYTTLVDFLTVSEETPNSVKLLAIADETVSLEDLLASSSNYSSTLEESVTFILVLDDGETVFKGYSYTPETFSVTEYTNYPFNSFAYINNSYLAASSEGLYLLEGTLDEDAFITARIKTASMDLETSNVKQVPQVYLGVDSDANLILTVSVDGKYTAQYELALDSEDLATQMFKIGKGLQGRYWQFTLETKENSNFDLDELEIFPITFGRKR